MSGIFPKAYNQLHLLQSWYFLYPVYTITASTEAVLPLSVSMNISWHQLITPPLHYKLFQSPRTTAVLIVINVMRENNIHFLLHFFVSLCLMK